MLSSGFHKCPSNNKAPNMHHFSCHCPQFSSVQFSCKMYVSRAVCSKTQKTAKVGERRRNTANYVYRSN